MPQRNTIRKYFAGGYYHVYNRGVEKRIIFNEDQDYVNFLSRIESYMTPKKAIGEEIPVRYTPYWRSKLKKDEVEIICYCLMPNHFHFILKQNSKNGITRFLRRLSNSYVGYFNKKYDRAGTLFQGKFKAALIENEGYLLYLSRYIHLNCKEVGPLDGYPYSSYWEYLEKRKTSWVHPRAILSYFRKTAIITPLFKKTNTYKLFVEGETHTTSGVPDELTFE
jgi:putative transposase